MNQSPKRTVKSTLYCTMSFRLVGNLLGTEHHYQRRCCHNVCIMTNHQASETMSRFKRQRRRTQHYYCSKRYLNRAVAPLLLISICTTLLLILPTVSGEAQDNVLQKVPHRRGNGRIKVRLTPKVFEWLHNNGGISTNAHDKTRRTILESHLDSAGDGISSELSRESSYTRHNSTWRSTLSQLRPRGLLLFGLVVLSVARSGVVPLSAMSSRGGHMLASSAVQGSSGFQSTLRSFLPTQFSIQWSKLIPQRHEFFSVHKLTTSLLSSMLIVWIPTLAMQGAWLELLLMGVSLTSNRTLRWYTQYELLPTTWSIIQKMLVGEVWKHVWEFLLDPFPSNFLVPNKSKKETAFAANHHVPGDGRVKDGEDANTKTSKSWTGMVSLYASEMWHRMHVRVDKMTVSLLKKSVEKSVESSMAQLLPNTWNPEVHLATSKSCVDTAPKE